jgi:hypothetical protein
MLAQNFMTAADLGLDDDEHAALVTVLGMLERGELHHTRAKDIIPTGEKPVAFTGNFNMEYWTMNTQNCGTVCCIGGSAELIGGLDHDRLFNKMNYLPKLGELFLLVGNDDGITPAQAGIALRNYLTTGDPRWNEARA